MAPHAQYPKGFTHQPVAPLLLKKKDGKFECHCDPCYRSSVQTQNTMAYEPGRGRTGQSMQCLQEECHALKLLYFEQNFGNSITEVSFDF